MLRVLGVVFVVDAGLEELRGYSSLGTGTIDLNFLECFLRFLGCHCIRRHKTLARMIRKLTHNSHAYALRSFCICSAGGSVLF